VFTVLCQTIVAEVLAVSTRAAFVSTPSIFFSLPEGPVKSGSKVLDVRTKNCVSFSRAKSVAQYDRKWHAHPGFVFYDFNNPLDLDPSLQHVSFLILRSLARSLFCWSSHNVCRHLTWWSVIKSSFCAAEL
jgi:hypothetical protein